MKGFAWDRAERRDTGDIGTGLQRCRDGEISFLGRAAKFYRIRTGRFDIDSPKTGVRRFLFSITNMTLVPWSGTVGNPVVAGQGYRIG